MTIGRVFHWYVKFDNAPPVRLSARTWVEFKEQLDRLVEQRGWFQWVIEDGNTRT